MLRLQISAPEDGRFSGPSFTLSRDGEQAAFVVMIRGKRELWVRSLNSASARKLPGIEDAWFPFFSPDGKSIGFWMASKYWRMDLAGGPPLAILEGDEKPRPVWTDDGRMVFSSSRSIMTVPISGGNPTPISSGAGQSMISPLLLPHGGLLYFAYGGDKPGIYANSVDKPGEQRFVVTIAGHGYRFVPEVRQISDLEFGNADFNSKNKTEKTENRSSSDEQQRAEHKLLIQNPQSKI